MVASCFILRTSLPAPMNNAPRYLARSPGKGKSIVEFFGPLTPPRSDASEEREKNAFCFPTKSPFWTFTPGKTNYVSGHDTQVFPLNPTFHARAPVGEESRRRIARLSETESSRSVAQKFGLSIERVEAITRLVNIENEWKTPRHRHEVWREDLKSMSDSVLSMMPQDSLRRHEPLHDEPTPIEADRAAFVLLDESASFTREDAAREFGIDLSRDKDVAARAPKRTWSVQAQSKGKRECTWKFVESSFSKDAGNWGRATHNDRKKGARILW